MLVFGCLGAALATGCGKKAAPATESPGADMADAEGAAEEASSPEGETASEGDALASSLMELEAHEDQLLEAGIELPEGVQKERAFAGRTSEVPAATDAVPGRCQRVCDLATAICSLRDQICTLSDEHDGEVRYANACDRATLDCQRATEACEGCDG